MSLFNLFRRKRQTNDVVIGDYVIRGEPTNDDVLDYMHAVRDILRKDHGNAKADEILEGMTQTIVDCAELGTMPPNQCAKLITGLAGHTAGK